MVDLASASGYTKKSSSDDKLLLSAIASRMLLERIRDVEKEEAESWKL